MSKTVIHNRSGGPVPLPWPFQGVLAAGAEVCVDAPIAVVKAALGGSRVDGTLLSLFERDSTPADAFYLGTLQRRVRLTGLDGSTSPDMVVLPAAHTPGLYNWSTELDKQVAGSAGTVTCTLNYNHPDGGARQKARTALALTGTGGFSIGVFGFESNGVGPVVVNNVCASAAGGPVFSLTHGANLVG